MIDWDDILLAPIKRDLWYHKEEDLVSNYYPDYIENNLAYSYYLLQRFLDDTSGFLDELFKPNISESEKDSIVGSLQRDVFEWTLPLVKKIKLCQIHS